MTTNDLANVLKNLVSYREVRDNTKKIVKASRARVVQSGRGKDYPGTRPLISYRAVAFASPTIYSIIIFRKHQILKKSPILVPRRKEEPPFRFDLLEYDPESYMNLPSIDFEEVLFLVKVKEKLKREKVISTFVDKKVKEVLSKQDVSTLDYLNEKHKEYFLNRIRDTKKILNFLEHPDPIFSEQNTINFVLGSVLDDILTIDRGVLIKIRDEDGNIKAITPVDGTTIKPLIEEETGMVEAYVQEVDGELVNIIKKEDVVLFRQNYTSDIYMYGYSVPPVEVIYNVALTDLFIDKGNLDYYKKGGSIPEGIITVEPPAVNNSDVYPQLSKETLEGIQRQMQAIMLGDYTQVPILSGGKFTWIDFKGKRRDMQYKELADYVARKICAIYQVSPQDVGILGDVNRATAETMASLTKAKGLEPLISTISESITNGVIDELRKEKDLKFWFEEDDFEKTKEWWQVANQQLSSGYRSINELRMERGLSPVPWGDAPMMGLRNWEPPKEQQEGEPGAAGGNPLAALFGGGAGGAGAGAAGGNPLAGGAGMGAGGGGLEQLLGGQKSLETIFSLVTDENYLADDDIKTRVYKALGIYDYVEGIEEKNEEVNLKEFTKDILNKVVKDLKIDFSPNKVVLYVYSDIIEKNKIISFLSNFFKFLSTPRIVYSTNLLEVNLNDVERIKVDEETKLDNLLNKYKVTKIIFIKDPKEFYEITTNEPTIECLQYFQYIDDEDVKFFVSKFKNDPNIFEIFNHTISDESKELVINEYANSRKIKSKYLLNKNLSASTLKQLATILLYEDLDKKLKQLETDKDLLSIVFYTLIPSLYCLSELDSIFSTNSYLLDGEFKQLIKNESLISKNEELSTLYRILDTIDCYKKDIQNEDFYYIYLKFSYFINTLHNSATDLKRLSRYLISLFSLCKDDDSSLIIKILYDKDYSVNDFIEFVSKDLYRTEKSLFNKYIYGEKLSEEDEILVKSIINNISL